MENIINGLKTGIKNKFQKTVLNPINELVDQNLMDVSTTIGSFIVRSVRGKFQRSISFTIGNNYADKWMEEALYGILYEYNDVKASSRLELTNKPGVNDGSSMYYRLDDGTHNLKYREYKILLCIQTVTPQAMSGRITRHRIYTIITYDLSPEFVTHFERDMLKHRNSLLQIKGDSPTVNVYQDLHESDGYTYWEKTKTIHKRRLGSVYLPKETKKLIVDTVNSFFSSKEYYIRHGVAHNLKILLYGPPGPQPLDTIIPTPDGPKKMGDINPGDKVFAFSGQPTEVEEIYGYDSLEVYKVTFSDGRSTRCAKSHKFPVFIDGIYAEMSVEDLIEAFKDKTYPEVPMPGAVSYPFTNDYRIDPWAFGMILGGGSYKSIFKGMGDPVLVFEGESDPAHEIATRLSASLALNSLGPCDEREWVFFGLENGSISLASKKSMMDCINGSGSNDYARTDDENIVHTIPKYYMYNSLDIRWELIQGLFDSSGSFIECNGELLLQLHVGKLGDKLRSDIMELIYSVGYSCELTRWYAGSDVITINCAPRDFERFFRISIFKDRLVEYRLMHPFMDDIKYKLFITDIEATGHQVDMRCLHVKDSRHLYLTTDYLVTCNSGKDTIAKMIASEWNRNMYYVNGGKNGKFIPDAITSNDEDDVNYPLFLVSDIDKYPFLINEPDVKLEKDGGAKEEDMNYKQSFGSMINALDGVVSGEDRIIVMTTNHIEKFSETFLRPGRIDLKLYIGYVTPEVFRKYVYDFYNVELPADIKLNSDEITVAKMQFDVVFLKLSADEFIKKYTSDNGDKKKDGAKK